MFLELREIEIGENWFNEDSENIVVVDEVFIEKGVVQVDYTYLESEDIFPYCSCELGSFMKEYIRMPYSVNEGRDYESK